MHPQASRHLLVRIFGFVLAVVGVLACPLPPSAFGRSSDPPAHLITIKTSNTPLATVLDQVCKDLDITYTSFQDLREPVTADLQNVPPEEALQQLLAGWNSIFVYDQTRPDGLRKILVLSRKEARSREEQSDTPPVLSVAVTQREVPRSVSASSQGADDSGIASSSPDNEADLYGSGVFLSPDRQDLPQEILTEDLSVTSAPLAIDAPPSPAASSPQKTGVRIAAIKNDFLRTGLGLQEGDIVRDINGSPVDDPSQFIAKISEAIKGDNANILRLEVERKEEVSPTGSEKEAAPSGQSRTIIQPIYIDLGERDQ